MEAIDHLVEVMSLSIISGNFVEDFRPPLATIHLLSRRPLEWCFEHITIERELNEVREELVQIPVEGARKVIWTTIARRMKIY